MPKNIHKKANQYNATKGERFIENYLFKSSIKYIEQYKINDLLGDTKSYRVADFYLPHLGFYIEYEGLNNKSKEYRNQYENKRKIYIQNGKPTIFLVPEDLGILDFAIDSEIKRLFKYSKYRSPWQVIRYSLNRYFVKGKFFRLILALYFYLMGVISGGFDLGVNEFFRLILSWSSYLLALYCFWVFVYDILQNGYFDGVNSLYTKNNGNGLKSKQ